MSKMTGGDLVVESLINLGVRQFFTVSGGPINQIYRAAAERSLEIVHTRHELAACHMAEAVSRISGIPGVAVVTLGPATTNTLTGAMMATMSGTPLLIIGGQCGIRLFETGTDMAIDGVSVMKPLTKFAARVLQTDRIPEYIEMAWRVMWAGRPGPAFLEIPIDVLGSEVQPKPPSSGPPARVPGLAEPAKELIRKALLAAKRPLLIIGDEVLWEWHAGFDAKRLRAAIDRHGVPFATLRHARGAVDERHPLCLGQADVFASRSLHATLAEADLVLVLGHHLEFAVDFGSPISSDAKVVQCYCDPSFVGKGRHADVAAVTGVAPVVELLNEIAPINFDRQWIKAVTSRWQEELKTTYNPQPNQLPLHPAVAVRAVIEAMPEETIFVTGHGNVDYWADGLIQVTGPARYIRGGLGGAVGPEIPYAVGARFAKPGSPVVVFVGDGAVGYHGVELDTAERYDRPIIIVVLDDRKWGAIALPQQRTLGRDYAVDLRERDWRRFAEALGGKGYRAETTDMLRMAVADAYRTGEPAIIQVPVQCVISPFMNAFGF